MYGRGRGKKSPKVLGKVEYSEIQTKIKRLKFKEGIA